MSLEILHVKGIDSPARLVYIGLSLVLIYYTEQNALDRLYLCTCINRQFYILAH